jgi:hypothetical protein
VRKMNQRCVVSGHWHTPRYNCIAVLPHYPFQEVLMRQRVEEMEREAKKLREL